MIISLAVVGRKYLNIILLQELLESRTDVGGEGHLPLGLQEFLCMWMWDARCNFFFGNALKEKKISKVIKEKNSKTLSYHKP